MSHSATSNTLYTRPPYNEITKSRLQALYADITRQKASNPIAYQSSIEWWRKALETIVSSGIQDDNSRLVLHARRPLIDSLKYDGVGKPLALGAVIAELQEERIIIPESSFIDATQSIYNSGWLPGRIVAYVVGKPLWWAFEQLGITGDDGIMGSSHRGGDKNTSWWNDYVVVPLVEATADSILEAQRQQYGAGDKIYNTDRFRREFGSILGVDGQMNERDCKILVRFLERDKKAVVVDKDAIKFITEGTDGSREITSVDRGILELKTAIESMHRQVDGLQGRIDKLTAQASEALRQQRKPIALNHLRVRKQYQDTLALRLKSLENLEGTMSSIESAASNIEIMKTYATSTATLKAILSDPLLQHESIDQTMDALAEANMEAKEIDEAMRNDPGHTLEIDESELEAELQDLVKQATQAEASAKADALHAISAPQHSPSPDPVSWTERVNTPIVMS